MADAYWDPAGDEPVTASTLNKGAVFNADDAADLTGVNMSGAPTGLKYLVADTGNLYLYDSGSSATPDGYSVIQPTVGSGRFILKSGGNGSVVESITTDTTAVPGKAYVCNSTSPIKITAPSVISVGQAIEILSVNTGGWRFALASSQSILYKNTSISGTGNGVRATQNYTSLKLFYAATNTWVVQSSDGTYDGNYAKGFMLGGYNGVSWSNTIDDLNFSTESSDLISATLGSNLGQTSSGAQSSFVGYAMGGQTSAGVFTTSIFKLNFITELTGTTSGSLSVGKGYGANASSSTKGYLLGGADNVPNYYTAIDALTFSSEAVASLAATLNTGKFGGTGGQSSTKGYILGGATSGGNTNVIEDLAFSGETSVPIAATLSGNRVYLCGVSSSSKIYTLGGDNSGTVNTIDALVFSGETCGAIVATLPSATGYQSSVESSAKGYAMGGENGGGSYQTRIDALVFSGETTSTISATLNAAKTLGAGVSYAG